ncbi:SRPBCC family protein [Microtetraspora fusca]|uniref:SRPBCC family protein n=1 Tax=Microtetraspora fusca TaxID=1997 RepID=A0ABW6VEM9_MICFU|nr:SRPBCC family protein [Microtetraspora fusca]
MSLIEHSVNVNVPVRTAYNQWTQFESFPEFMEGVDSIKQVTESRTYWAVEIGGVRREFDAEITEQHPDERVAWHSLDRPHHSGVVTFHRLDDDHCRVTLQLEYDPEGVAEMAADLLQIVRRRVKGDLERFKTFIEGRGTESGGWRGDIPGPHQQGGFGTGYDIGEPMPPQPVNPEYPPKSPLPAPGPGPVPPEGGPGTTLPRA